MYNKGIQRVEVRVEGWRGWLTSEIVGRRSDVAVEKMVDARLYRVHTIDAWDLNDFLLRASSRCHPSRCSSSSLFLFFAMSFTYARTKA